MSHWLAEGRTLGESLRRFTCIVVVGGDQDATAEVALGIAEAQAAHRRVVLGDLFGDATPFAALRGDDDHHGLVDAFDYGISLTRVLRPVAGNDRLHFAPTGSDVPDYDVLLGHPRWTQLIGAFAESEQLLIIALPVDARRLQELVARTDGAVLVDSVAPPGLEPSRVIASLRPKPALLPRASAPALPAVVAGPPPPRRVSRPVAPVPAPRPSGVASPPRRPTRAADAGPARPQPPQRQTGAFVALAKPVGAGAALSILAALLIFWLVNRPLADRAGGIDSTGAPAAELLAADPAIQRPAPPSADPNLVDPADSGAAVYAVQIMAANTQAGAILKVQEDSRLMPAATFAPVEIQGRTWYKVLTGAYTTRGGADSLLSALRTGGLLDSLSPGVVVRVPFAVRIDSIPKSATVSEYLKGLRDGRRLPAYALDQENGWVCVFVGAFETRSQADSYAERLRAQGISAAELAFRKGRMF